MYGWFSEIKYIHFIVAVVIVALISLSVSLNQDFMDESEEVETDQPKVALIVFDGADWKVINQLREEERLPHFREMMNRGVYGDIKTPKAFSPVTWTKIGTGKEAKDLNVDGWNIEKEDGGRRMVQSTDVEHKRIWNYLNMYNVSTGVTNYFLTWPVEKIDGFMIAGSLAAGDRKLAYPAGEFNQTIITEGHEWKIANMVLDEAKDDYNFHTLGFKRLDAKQHSLWKYIVPEKFGLKQKPENEQYREVIYTEYENMDKVLSRFDESWNVILVSDSGFEAEGGYQAKTLEDFYTGKAPPGFVYPTYEGDLNPLLKQLGYLKYSTRSVLGEDVRDYKDIQLKRCSIDYPKPTYLNSTTYFFRLCVEDSDLDLNSTISNLEAVDYRDGRDFFQRVRYNSSINSILGRWRYYPDGVNQTIVERSYSHQPTYNGKIPEVNKAVGLRLPDGDSFDLWIGPEKSGDHPGHKVNGIFLARGPDINNIGNLPESNRGNFSKGQSPEISVVDVAPTILYMYDIPVPRKMDGRVVSEIFTEDFNERREVRYSNISTLEGVINRSEVNETKSKAIKSKLRGLGYLN